jgi:hypothetical protein
VVHGMALCSHSCRHTDPCMHAFWSIPGAAFSSAKNQRPALKL